MPYLLAIEHVYSVMIMILNLTIWYIKAFILILYFVIVLIFMPEEYDHDKFGVSVIFTVLFLTHIIWRLKLNNEYTMGYLD